MLVSVIVPVYNAEKFVREAVESALAQPETGEVILVEDASPDNSLVVCEQLAEEYDRVTLLRHADGKNHGAGASRNLGIVHAQFDCIAFLDADDFFLPDRFSVAAQVFAADPTVDGVYEAVGVQCEDHESKQKWLRTSSTMLTTMVARVEPDQLFETQSPIGPSGHCPTGGWVVKRSLFERTGLFDEHLRLHQDTVMYVKFAALGKMVPGRLDEPVAMRRVHASNRFLKPRSAGKQYKNRLRMWGTMWTWGKRNLPDRRRQILLKRLVEYALADHPDGKPVTFWRRSSRWARQMALLLYHYPGLLLRLYFWRRLVWTVKAAFQSDASSVHPA